MQKADARSARVGGVSTIPPLFLAHPPAHGDVSLAQEGDWRMILRKGKVEIGNPGLEALEVSGADEAVLILEVIHAFEADENQVLEEMQASVEF